MSYPKIALPAELEDHEVIASVSGGKDSTALMLALREAGIPFRAVFADTGWEHPDVYAYLDMLHVAIQPIDTVGFPGGMLSKIAARAGFPARVGRWCTRELKLEPIQIYTDRVRDWTGRAVVAAVGIRRDESEKRKNALELEREADFAVAGTGPEWIWRPLVDWTVEDVLRIHAAHRIPVNPLYQRGHNRVGCWPCIHSSKAEIRLLADTDPARVDQLRALEAEVTKIRAAANAERPNRYGWEEATFFQGAKDTPLGTCPGIDTVVEWSRTKDGGPGGGRQLMLVPHEPEGGCMRWGLCDVPDDEASR
jgi:3'-phosphoadenosine 5'-phosphosulfate sulfotransferase (PAPS reductase)/FAD synthetase